MAETAWTRLVRYTSAEGGKERYGEPIIPSEDADIGNLADAGNLSVHICEGSDALSARPSEREDRVKQLLGPGEKIPIPKVGQAQCDYEGELVILIGKVAKNVHEGHTLDHIAAYTCGNGVSARDSQREPGKAGAIPQWSFSKSFDKYAPLGPCLVARKLLEGADKQELQTIVNGDVRQQGITADLCFGVRQLVAFCSQGQTLQKASLIMTDAPDRVGLFMKLPCLLKDGDEVKVKIGGIGTLRNIMHFE